MKPRLEGCDDTGRIEDLSIREKKSRRASRGPRKKRNRKNDYSGAGSLISARKLQTVSKPIVRSRPLVITASPANAADEHMSSDPGNRERCRIHASISKMAKNRPPKSRRRSKSPLSRKIFVYFTDEERKLVDSAADAERRSISSFVANAAIAAAEQIQSRQGKKK